MIDMLGSILASDLQVTYLDNYPGV